MGRLAATEGLTEVQIEILSTVKDFVDKEILPYATDLEHKDEFPEAIVEGMKEMGAPEGFIDVVAALNPIDGGDSDTPAHWSVTFAVDDADAAAASARELGGKVLAGPVDAPWTRMAVIEDPQGATFIASQFVLENKDLTA